MDWKNKILLLIMFCLIFVRACSSFYSRKAAKPPARSQYFTNYNTRNGLSGDFVTDIIEDQQGRIWLATWGGVSVREHNQWKQFRVNNSGLINNNITSIAEDKEGNIWVGTSGVGGAKGGVSKYDGKSWYNYTDKDGLDVDNVVDLLFDKNNNLWVATWGDGAYRYDGESWRQYTVADGLASDNIVTVAETSAGIWFGTKEGKGVTLYNGVAFFTYDEHNSGLIDNNVHAVAEQGKYLWFGTWGGVNRVGIEQDLKSFDNWERYTSYDKRLPASFVRCITPDGPRIWFGTQKGITVFDGKNTWSTFTTTEKRKVIFDAENKKIGEEVKQMEGLCSNHIYCIFVDSKKNVWIGTDRGVSVYHPEL